MVTTGSIRKLEPELHNVEMLQGWILNEPCHTVTTRILWNTYLELKSRFDGQFYPKKNICEFVHLYQIMDAVFIISIIFEN